MADRTVSVILQARITDYMAKMSAASKATSDFANKVDVAKGKAAQGYHSIGVAGVAVGAVVAGGFALAIKSATDFNAKMVLVATLSHASAKDVGRLSDAALHVGQQFGYTATQVADAEAELVKAGVSVSDIMGGALTGALTLASAGQTDVATATTIAATAMTQFGLAGKDVPHIADLLAAGADKALGSVVDLGYALDQAGPTAHAFGLSIEETVGTLAAFAQSGQIGERGGTILTQMLLKMAAPGKQASDILNQLGISLYGLDGKFVGMANLAGQLKSKMTDLTLAERNHDLAVIFGQRAIRGANILYQDGATGIANWTKKVNDSGFATLQATGKLNSLSGDVQKLGAALQTALIGAGETGMGRLRGMTQDVTKAVDVWNKLPEPVHAAGEAMVFTAGGIALLGGATILFIPKWTAMNAALQGTAVGAISAEAALTGLGKVVAGVALVIGSADLAGKISKSLEPGVPAVDEMTQSLITLGKTGQDTGSLAKTFGSNFSDLGSEIRRAFDKSTFQSVNDTLSSAFSFGHAHLGSLTEAQNDLKGVDNALAAMVTSGHMDQAEAAFNQITAAAKRQGVGINTLKKAFPALSSALYTSQTSARLAGNGIDKFGNTVQAAAKKTVTAAQAATNYGTALHALADPLFAMNQALQGVTDAQGAASVATRKYGKDSAQARQANLALASAALDAEAAAKTLAAAVENGSVSIGDARKYLHDWVADGLLTKAQAQNVSNSFDHLIGRAQTLSGLHPNVTVTANTAPAESALGTLLDTIGHVIAGFLGLGQVSGGGALDTALGTSNDGRYAIRQPLTSSNPKTTRKPKPPASTDTGYTIPYSSGSGGGSSSGGGGGGGGSAGTKQRPPTTAEIVQAILNGTIPPSIDELRKTLQSEIGHLSTVVGNAEQYRNTINAGLRGYAGIANMTSGTAGTDILGATGRASKPNVDAYLKGRAHKLQQFAHLLKRLDNEHLDPDLLSQFAQVGPDAIPAMQQLLGTGKHGIRRANRYETQIRHYAGTTATLAANDKYATQLIRSVDKLPAGIGRAVAKGLRGAHFHVSYSEGDRKGGHKVRTHS